MLLTNLTSVEKTKLLSDMTLFGYFQPYEIETFIDEEYLDKELINKVGKYICDITNNKSENYNKIVYDYIINVDAIQTLVKYHMNKAIMNSKPIINYFVQLTLNNNIKISKKNLLIIILKWYNDLYDLAGILEYPCLSVVLNVTPFRFDYSEQVYNMIIDFIKK